MGRAYSHSLFDYFYNSSYTRLKIIKEHLEFSFFTIQYFPDPQVSICGDHGLDSRWIDYLSELDAFQ